MESYNFYFPYVCNISIGFNTCLYDQVTGAGVTGQKYEMRWVYQFFFKWTEKK